MPVAVDITYRNRSINLFTSLSHTITSRVSKQSIKVVDFVSKLRVIFKAYSFRGISVLG